MHSFITTDLQPSELVMVRVDFLKRTEIYLLYSFISIRAGGETLAKKFITISYNAPFYLNITQRRLDITPIVSAPVHRQALSQPCETTGNINQTLCIVNYSIKCLLYVWIEILIFLSPVSLYCWFKSQYIFSVYIWWYSIVWQRLIQN